MTTLRLALPTPYDWATVVGYFVPRAIPGVELATEHHYWRTLVIGGRPGTLSVHVDTGSRLVASVETGARVSRREVEVALRRMFDLDADIEAVRQRLGRDARIARRLERCPGLRVVGGWDPFELSIRAILGQQVSVAAATRLAGRLVQRCGVPIAVAPDAGLTHLFPTPTQLATADLGDMGMPGARVRTMQRLGASVADDPSLLASTGDMAQDLRRLRSLPGIGEWTANYIALRALRHYDAFPASDIGLLRAMETRGRRPSPKELEQRAERWRPFRGYAAMCLWMT